MNRIFQCIFASALLALFAVSAVADIIPADRKVDWRLCGIPGGIPVRTNTPYTNWMTADLSSNASAKIQKALNDCTNNGVVLLPTGTFTLSAYLTIPSGVTLRGSGMNSTILSGVAPSAQRAGLVTIGVIPSNKTAWLPIASGATNGSTNIVLASADTKITVGSIVYVDETNSSWLVSNGGAGGTKNDTDDRSGGVPGTHNVSQQVEILEVVQFGLIAREICGFVN